MKLRLNMQIADGGTTSSTLLTLNKANLESRLWIDSLRRLD
jgi:hypothetical protein